MLFRSLDSGYYQIIAGERRWRASRIAGLTEVPVRVIEADGEEGVNQLIEAGEEPFDLVFIDAAKSHYKRFLEASLPLCKPGAVIISDNVLFKARIASDQYDPTGKHKTNIKKMREYLEFINDDPRFDTTVVACGDGLSISKLK